MSDVDQPIQAPDSRDYDEVLQLYEKLLGRRNGVEATEKVIGDIRSKLLKRFRINLSLGILAPVAPYVYMESTKFLVASLLIGAGLTLQYTFLREHCDKSEEALIDNDIHELIRRLNKIGDLKEIQKDIDTATIQVDPSHES